MNVVLSDNYELVSYLIRYYLSKNTNLRESTILDFGCGNGQLLSVLKNQKIGRNLFGVDIFDDEEYKTIKSNLKDITIKNIKPYEKIDFKIKFDIIIANQVFEHIEDIEKVCSQLSSILKPNGVLIAGFPTKEIILEPHLKLLFLHLLPKNSFLLELYLKCASFLNIGSFKKYRYSNKSEKLAYLKKKISFVKEELFYRPSKKYIYIFKKYFSNIKDISYFTNYCKRPYQTPLNFLKKFIQKVPFLKLRIYITKKLFGSYFLINK